MMPRFELTSECHLLGCVASPDELETQLAYFPLQSLVLNVNSRAASILEALRAGPMQVESEGELGFLEQLVAIGVVNGQLIAPPRGGCVPPGRAVRTMLLTSDRCNLKCRYCYGAAETTGDLMPLEIAQAVLDLLLRNAVSGGYPSIDVSFHGGGEPTTNWSVVSAIIERAEEACAARALRLTSTLCTNGMLSLSQIDWMADHIPGIVISIDGPPDIQNVQRPTASGGPSFEQVARTADRLRELGKTYVMRVTATRIGEGRLADIYSWLAERFVPRAVCIEPLFACGRCATTGAEPPRPEVFVQDLMATFRRERRDVAVVYSGGRIARLAEHFCGAAGSNFFVTPRGEVTSCVEVSRASDPRSSAFFYGEYDARAGAFVFNEDRHRRLSMMSVAAVAACDDCFARWHCAGDCPAKTPVAEWSSSPRNAYRCLINREVTRAILSEQARRSIKGCCSATSS